MSILNGAAGPNGLLLHLFFYVSMNGNLYLDCIFNPHLFWVTPLKYHLTRIVEILVHRLGAAELLITYLPLVLIAKWICKLCSTLVIFLFIA